MQEQSTLNLIYKLCQILKLENISYCHWKSNAALDRSASGDNDLDLLISRTDAQRFTEILAQLGFKQAKTPVDQQMPGVLDYYGYDEGADKFVHVHAHYQLILGHDRTKNYRLPIEEPFLASASQGDLFKVPTPEFELIVLIIRMILKYSTWDVLLVAQGTVPVTARKEITYLQERVDWSRIYDNLKQHLPYIDTALFDACVQSLQPDCPVWRRIKVGHQLQKQMQPYARRSHLIDISLKVWRRLVRATRRRVLRRLPKKGLANGGLMIAVVGGDGSGKSTSVAELYGWLSKNFDTLSVHLGRPPRSLLTNSIRGALKLGRFLTPFLKRQPAVGAEIDADSPAFLGYSKVLWQSCTVRDRYLSYVRARRFATNGGIVICDRFPLSQIELMDGPQLEQMIDAKELNRFTKFLVRLEKKWYRFLVLPEVLIVLKLDPEIAVQRKVEEESVYVRARSTEIWELDWQLTPAYVIDASRSKEEVIAQLKTLIWSAL